MRKVVIIPNTTKDTDLAVTERLVSKLDSLGISSYIHRSLPHIGTSFQYDSFPYGVDLIVVVGGDGSVIDASRLAVLHDLPLLGINMGRIGYLSEVDVNMLDDLDMLASGEYFIDEKLLITVGDNSFAVNDVVISHCDYLGVSDFKLVDSVGNSISYRADGIILATPQGSTAYSLSAGGPIVAHNVDCILATPVCPHSFFNRTVLFNATEALTVTNTSAQPMNVSVDGRKHSVISPGCSVTVTRAPRSLKMLTFTKNSMFNELFRKMSILEGLK